MQLNKKLIARRFAIVFLAVMLFFTFSSRTILYYMTPKVTAARPESGFITNTYSFNNVQYYSEDSVEIRIPFMLGQGIYISEIAAGKGSAVKAGDPLITFDSQSFDSLLAAVKREHDAGEVELLEFDKGFADRIAQLENEIDSCSSEIAKLNAVIGQLYINDSQLIELQQDIKTARADYEAAEEKHSQIVKLYESGAVAKSDVDESAASLARLKDRIIITQDKYNRLQNQLLEQGRKLRTEFEHRKASAQADLKYMQETGIYNGKTRDGIIAHTREVQERLELLEGIIGTQTLSSPVDGIITGIFTEKQERYDGMNALMVIRPDKAKTGLLVPLANEQEKLFKESGTCEIEYEEKKIKAEISAIKQLDGKPHMLLEPVTEPGAEAAAVSGGESGTEAAASGGIGFGPGTDSQDGFSIRVNTKSEFYSTILPNSAFISQNKVYILKQRQGFWGEEYYITEREVITGNGNEYVTHVADGLSPNETVVTGWDREIRSGMRVMLPLK